MDALQLKISRIRLGLNQWELAKMAGISHQRISEMELCQRPIAECVVHALDRALAEAVPNTRG